MLVDEVEGTNQLVESCKTYLPSELFIMGQECLAYFNHFATFPFLNCVEISIQADLLLILTKLHEDLKAKRVDILSKFIVSIHGMSTPTLSSDLSKRNVDKMCISAASAVKLQCGREYGFSDAEKRATDLSIMAANKLEGLPTNNLVTVRDLLRFNRDAKLQKVGMDGSSKNIHNNMVLYKTKSEIKVDKISKKIAAILNQHEER